MKKNGFTLVELLTVIIILGIIVMIAMPVVEDAIKDSEERAYITQLRGIEDGAKNWVAEHILEAPKKENDTKTLELEELIQGGYIDKDLVNPKTKQPFRNVKVVITYENGTLEYTLYENNKVINFD